MGQRPIPAMVPRASELAEIRRLIESRSGMFFGALAEEKFSGCVREYIQKRRLPHAAELLRRMRSSRAEYESLLARLRTPGASFFAHPLMFEVFEKVVLPEIHMRKFWDTPRALRIWSAGCGAGHEPYSIALTVAETVESAENWVLDILATDISQQAISNAQRGVYALSELGSMPRGYLEAHFAKIGEQFLVKPRIRNMVTFSSAGLPDNTYLGKFDCIFCTESLAYFSEEKRAALLERFYDSLEPDGYTFLPQAYAPSVPAGMELITAGDIVIYYRGGPTATRSCLPSKT